MSTKVSGERKPSNRHSADHVERALRQVEHIQQPKDKREAGCHQR